MIKKPASSAGFKSDTVGIRTPNLRIRSAMLYPVELQCHSVKRGANIASGDMNTSDISVLTLKVES